MQFTYRKATEADRAKYLDFANMVFSCAHQPHDFQALIPKVYGADKQTAHMQNIAVAEDGGIRGLVAVMPNEMTVMGEVLKTGFVGTVSVHPYARGEGHMKKLMAMAIEDMKDDGVDLAMLGGQRQRYEYFGFTKDGIALYHTVSRANVRHALKDVCADKVEIVPVTAEDTDAVAKALDLHCAKKLYAKRNAEDFHVICRTWHNSLSSIFVDGAYAGYMVCSERDDGMGIQELVLKDYGNTRAVVKKLMEKSWYKGLSITTADFETELNRALMAFEENVSVSAPVMLRVFNFRKVIGAFMKLKASYRKIEDGVRGFVIDGEQVTVCVKGGQVCVSDEKVDGSVELTAMQAQELFFNANGWNLGYDMPMGWTGLPVFIGNVDEF